MPWLLPPSVAIRWPTRQLPRRQLPPSYPPPAFAGVAAAPTAAAAVPTLLPQALLPARRPAPPSSPSPTLHSVIPLRTVQLAATSSPTCPLPARWKRKPGQPSGEATSSGTPPVPLPCAVSSRPLATAATAQPTAAHLHRPSQPPLPHMPKGQWSRCPLPCFLPPPPSYPPSAPSKRSPLCPRCVSSPRPSLPGPAQRRPASSWLPSQSVCLSPMASQAQPAGVVTAPVHVMNPLQPLHHSGSPARQSPA